MASDVSDNVAFLGTDTAAGDRVIGLGGRSLRELFRQAGMGGVVLGHDNAAARVLVESVDNTGAHDSPNAAELVSTVIEERVDQGSVRVAGRGVHADAR